MRKLQLYIAPDLYQRLKYLKLTERFSFADIIRLALNALFTGTESDQMAIIRARIKEYDNAPIINAD